MSVPSWAVKGAKVVCIRALFHYHPSQTKWAPNIPVFNGIYTIRKVLVCDGDRVGLLLEELHNPIGEHGWETGFEIEKFRPLVTVEDDINEHFAVYLKTGHRATERERA